MRGKCVKETDSEIVFKHIKDRAGSRFYRAAAYMPGECWRWPLRIGVGGYGRYTISKSGKRNKVIHAHRLIYQGIYGKLKPGVVLDHLCRNRWCVNPFHLDPVDKKTNTLRGTSPAANNARKTHCKQGHPFDVVLKVKKKLGIRSRRDCSICRRERARRGSLRYYHKNKVLKK